MSVSVSEYVLPLQVSADALLVLSVRTAVVLREEVLLPKNLSVDRERQDESQNDFSVIANNTSAIEHRISPNHPMAGLTQNGRTTACGIGSLNAPAHSA